MVQSSEDIRTLIYSVELNDPKAAERDIKNAFNNRQSNLILKIGDFYCHNGFKKKMLCVIGTITTEYHGSRYNTPVELWIQENHPHSAPICYVKLTSDMYISPTCPYVESDGRITHPYLHKWISTVSSSIMLINQFHKAFSDSPPLYSRPSSLQESSMSMQVSQNQSPIVNQNNSLNSADMNNNRCRICSKKDIDCVLLECGHLISCSNCAIRFMECPSCHKPVVRIKSILRT